MPICVASFLICAVFGAVTNTAFADDSAWGRSDPAAKERFHRTAEAYRSLSSYEDRGTFRRTIKLAGRERAEVAPLSLKFARSGKIVLEAGDVRVVGDGKTITTVLVPTKRYLSSPSASLDVTAIADGPAGAILLGSTTGPPAQLLLNLLLGSNPAAALPDRATSLKSDSDKMIEGKTFHVLRVELGEEPALRVLIDPDTHLIRRMDYILEPKAASDRLPKSLGDVSELTIAWDSGQIRTDPIPDDSFAFKPPADFERLKAAEAARPAANAKSEFLGKLAPEFTLTVLDGAGKTKKVTRADLAGKVVVLDFWATWCPPCLQELPEIQKLAESYTKAGKTGLIIVAVSQDRAPDDGSPVRVLVESLLKTKQLELDRSPLSRVALDPNQDVGDAFKVQALPTVVILDAKGVVQLIQVGYNDDVKDVLAAAIDSLLEGKSLVQPDADPAEVNKPRK